MTRPYHTRAERCQARIAIHIRAMTHPAANGERFLAAAGDFVSMRDVAMILKQRMGEAARKADAAGSRLAGAARRAARSGGETDPAGARQEKERDEREGAPHPRLDAAQRRGGDRCDRREPDAPPPAEALDESVRPKPFSVRYSAKASAERTDARLTQCCRLSLCRRACYQRPPALSRSVVFAATISSRPKISRSRHRALSTALQEGVQ
jgi:hypothetical protein